MDRKRVLLIMLAPVLLLALTGGYLYAQGPDAQTEPRGTTGGHPQAAQGPGFTYQGQLKDSGGNPIDDSCDFSFSLWDAESDGSQVGSDSVVTGIAVTEGYFAALVNSGGEFGGSAFAGEARWLEIAVQCTADPTPVTLSPRQPLSAAPYALYALSVASHDHWAETWSGSGTGLTLSGGEVGLSGSGSSTGVYGNNTATSDVAYGVYGQSSSSNGYGVYGYASASSGGTTGVRGQSDSTAGTGVYGLAIAVSGATSGVLGNAVSSEGSGVYGFAFHPSGTTYGVRGWSVSTAGRGVYGSASASSGETYGVYGLSASPDGRGVYGNNTATSGYAYGVYGLSASTEARAVYGYAGATSGTTYGVYGRSYSTDGRGVYGYASASSGETGGVRGRSDSTDGSGVLGWASASSGDTYGVYGQSDSTDGYGVHGWASATSGYTGGVYGSSDSTNGLGVLGHAWANSGTNYGVRGVTQSPAGYGVYYVGGLGGTGLQSTLVETPDHGWRKLYNVGSSDVLFEDVGTAQLTSGRVEVTIDPIFAQTVNLEASYQVFLTPLDDCGLYVAAKTATSFTVRALDGESCSIAFDYRLIAKRLGYEDTHLTVTATPASSPEVPERLAEEVRP